MGRRSDHNREELRELLITCGQQHMAEVGYARFSGREVAKRAGYSVGTIYNVFGALDLLVTAINSRTFDLWAAHLRACLERGGADRIRSLVEGYFSFAFANPNLWTAIYDHRLPEGIELTEDDHNRRGALTAIVEGEVALVLPPRPDFDIARLSRSLVAVVHGHCAFVVSGTFALLEEPDPAGAALDRVRESLEHYGYFPPEVQQGMSI